MFDLVYKAKDGEPVTDTGVIAEQTGVEHKNVLELVRKYSDDMNEFGGVAFETRPFDTSGGEQSRVVGLINEAQSMLLLSYMRNNDIVRSFKKALVRGFMDMREMVRAMPDPLAGLPAEQRALIAVMMDNAAIKQEQAAQSLLIAAQADSIKRLESKTAAIEDGVSFFTVLAYGSYRGIKFSLADASALGRAAAKLSKAADITIGKVRDPRFGLVNSYHESMLDAALAKTHGGM